MDNTPEPRPDGPSGPQDAQAATKLSIDELTTLYLRGRDTWCPNCGYNRRDATSMECPECGYVIRIVPIEAFNKDARRYARWIAIAMLVTSLLRLIIYTGFWIQISNYPGFMSTPALVSQGVTTFISFVLFAVSLGVLIASSNSREVRMRIGLIPIIMMMFLIALEFVSWVVNYL